MRVHKLVVTSKLIGKADADIFALHPTIGDLAPKLTESMLQPVQILFNSFLPALNDPSVSQLHSNLINTLSDVLFESRSTTFERNCHHSNESHSKITSCSTHDDVPNVSKPQPPSSSPTTSTSN